MLRKWWGGDAVVEMMKCWDEDIALEMVMRCLKRLSMKRLNFMLKCWKIMKKLWKCWIIMLRWRCWGGDGDTMLRWRGCNWCWGDDEMMLRWRCWGRDGDTMLRWRWHDVDMKDAELHMIMMLRDDMNENDEIEDAEPDMMRWCWERNKIIRWWCRSGDE